MLDKYQEKLRKLLVDYARNSGNMNLQLALRDVIGDLSFVAKELNLNFSVAVNAINNTYEDDLIDLAILEKEKKNDSSVRPQE